MNMSQQGEPDDEPIILLQTRKDRQRKRANPESVVVEPLPNSSTPSFNSSSGKDKLYLIPDATSLLWGVQLLKKWLSSNGKGLYFHFPASTIRQLDACKSYQDQNGVNSREASRFVELLISHPSYACISDKELPWKLCRIFYNDADNGDFLSIPKKYWEIIGSVLYRIHRRGLVRESQIKAASSSKSQREHNQTYRQVNSHLREYHGSLIPLVRSSKHGPSVHNWTLLTQDSDLASIASRFGISTISLPDIMSRLQGVS